MSDMTPRTLAIVQARMKSSRFPGKVLRPLKGRPVLAWVVRAARLAQLPDDVVVATTTSSEDDAIENAARRLGTVCVRGDEDDVLSRFAAVLNEIPADTILRLTADNPLVDPTVIDMALSAFGAGDVEYLSTAQPSTLPLGMGVEVVSHTALRRAMAHATGADRAHVTSWLYREPGRARIAGLTFRPAADDLRVTLDTGADARALDAIVEELGDRPPSWHDVVALLRSRPDIVAMNAYVTQKPLDDG